MPCSACADIEILGYSMKIAHRLKQRYSALPETKVFGGPSPSSQYFLIVGHLDHMARNFAIKTIRCALCMVYDTDCPTVDRVNFE